MPNHVNPGSFLPSFAVLLATLSTITTMPHTIITGESTCPPVVEMSIPDKPDMFRHNVVSLRQVPIQALLLHGG